MPEPVGAGPAAPETLLLIEDHPAMQEGLRLLLEPRGYRVTAAPTAEEGLARIDGVDLVLLDLMLPGMDGYAACREIRARRPELPVIIVTARADAGSAVDAFGAGADDYVTKPFRAAELLARVESRLRLRRAEASARASEERAQKQAERMRTVAAAAAGVLGARSLTELDVVIREACRRVLTFDAVTFGIYDAAEHTLRFAAAWDGDRFEAGGVLPLSGRPSEPVVRERRSFVVGRADDPDAQGAMPFGTGRRSESAIRTPILAGDRVIGVISVQSYARDRFTAEDVEVLEALAAVCATALETLELAAEREAAEQRIRESEARYRAFFEDDISGDYVADAAGRILDCNPAFLGMFGFGAREDAVGFDLAGLHASVETCEQITDALRTGGRAELRDLAMRRTDGEPLHVIMKVIGERDAAGDVVQMRGYIIDITARTRLEQQLRHAQRLDAIGRLAGGVAHDFNNLLTAITGHAQLLLLDVPAADPIREHLVEIQTAADRSAALTRQLLAFSRKQILQPRVTSLDEIVAGMEGFLRRLIGEHISVVTRLDRTPAEVSVDPGQMEQVLMNLVVNARDAMPRGGTVVLQTGTTRLEPGDERLQGVDAEAGDYAVLSVSDTGTGIDAAILPRVFEPFFTTKGPGQGTGLGLSTVYGIVKQSGGYVFADSAPGRGAAFHIYLPLARRPAEAAAPLPAGTGLVRGSETVLVVEDEPAVRSLIARVLRRAGYQVTEAESGIAALERHSVDAASVDLLLTDVVMPGISGRGLADRIREARPALPVLFMSGYTDDTIVHHGVLDAGVEFLQKPFTPEELLRKVRRVLDATADGAARR